jgi:hypothetical protein
MRLGQAEDYTIEDVTFRVRSEWRIRRAHEDRCRELRPRPDMTDEEKEQAGEARVASALQMLAEAIVSISGLEDADGAPITAWTDDVRWALPEPMVAELMSRVTLYQSDERLGELNTPNEASPS